MEISFLKMGVKKPFKCFVLLPNEDGFWKMPLNRCMNPNSHLTYWSATEILREIDFTDNSHPIIRDFKLSESGKDLMENIANIIKSMTITLMPWWHTKSVDQHDD
jgi:hypothetical protein